MSNLSEEKMVSKYGHTTITLDSEDIEKLLQGKELYNTDFDEYSFSVVAEEPIPFIPLAKVKQVREDVHNAHLKMLVKHGSGNLLIALEILDSLIAESEKK